MASMAVKLSIPEIIETADIYTFGFVDSIYGYVYVQGVDETAGGEEAAQPEEICTRAQIMTFLYRDLAM